ncbi:MAG: fimbrillin family protein [Bacteroidales bacterium]|nr:fimbrillin family protein [Bacteroidales bacterium]
MKAVFNILYLSIMLPSCSVNEYLPERASGFVRFNCSIDNETTKSFSYMVNGVMAIIYAFNENSIYYTVGDTPIAACSTGYGELLTNNPLNLPDGIYDFYSISYNSTITPSINFSQGYSDPPENGLDYLWASAIQMDLTSRREISLNYRHIACKIRVTINTGENVSSLSINDIQFTYPSNNGVALDLSQGVISPSQSVESLSSIPGSGSSRTFIVLPCTSPINVVVLMDASIDGEYNTGRRFQATLDSDLEGGKFYDITLTINSDNIYVTTFDKKEWEPILETITY